MTMNRLISRPMQLTAMSRLSGLMVLRVLATFAVVLGHSAAFFHGARFTQWPQFPYVQSVAVSLFFAVSGWTIAWVLDTREESFARFVFDRFARLAIPLFPVLLALIGVEVVVYHGHHPFPGNVSAVDFLGNLAFLQNVHLHLPFMAPVDLGIGPFSVDRPLWSLAREFWIYVAFGGLLVTARSGRFRIGVFAAALLGGVFVSDSLFGGYGAGLGLVWLAGAGLYHVQRQYEAPTHRHRLVLLPVQLFLGYCLFDDALWPPKGLYSPTWNLVIFANFACFMLLAPGARVPAAGLKVARFFGSFAYTAYLVHYPLLQVVHKEVPSAHGGLWVLGMVAASMVLAWLVGLVFERNYRSIRDFVWNRVTRATSGRRAAVPAAPVAAALSGRAAETSRSST